MSGSRTMHSMETLNLRQASAIGLKEWNVIGRVEIRMWQEP